MPDKHVDESGVEQSELEAWVFSLPYRARIPAEKYAAFEKKGVAPTAQFEGRRFPRFHCSGVEPRAGLEQTQSFPAMPREEEWVGVRILDVSRGGCRFLHDRQVYPGERFKMVFLTGLRQTVEIQWCRYIGNACYEVGAQYSV